MKFDKKKIAPLFFNLLFVQGALVQVFPQNKDIANATKTLYEFNFPKAISLFEKFGKMKMPIKKVELLPLKNLPMSLGGQNLILKQQSFVQIKQYNLILIGQTPIF